MKKKGWSSKLEYLRWKDAELARMRGENERRIAKERLTRSFDPPSDEIRVECPFELPDESYYQKANETDDLEGDYELFSFMTAGM
jgi:hypothetical protein